MNITQQQLHKALSRINELETEFEKCRRYVGCLILAAGELNIDFHVLDGRAKALLENSLPGDGEKS